MILNACVCVCVCVCVCACVCVRLCVCASLHVEVIGPDIGGAMQEMRAPASGES